MASRALALLDFWLVGPIEPTFRRVFLAPLLDYWSDHSPVAESGGFFGFSWAARVCVAIADRAPSFSRTSQTGSWLRRFSRPIEIDPVGIAIAITFRLHQKQSQKVRNPKYSWGSMPPDPPRRRASRETTPFSVVSEYPYR